MMQITHAGTQWTKLCRRLNMDPDVTTADEVLAGALVAVLALATEVTTGIDLPNDLPANRVLVDWFAERRQ
jgi:hypothetical protein